MGFLPVVPKHEFSKSALSKFCLSQGALDPYLAPGNKKIRKYLSPYIILPGISMFAYLEAWPMPNIFVLRGTFMIEGQTRLTF